MLCGTLRLHQCRKGPAVRSDQTLAACHAVAFERQPVEFVRKQFHVDFVAGQIIYVDLHLKAMALVALVLIVAALYEATEVIAMMG